MIKIDALDEKLLQLVGADATQASEEIAKKLNISVATVRRRIKKLTQSGVLHIVGVADPDKLGFSLAVVCAFDVTHEKLDPFIEWLASRPEVRFVSASTGRYDVISMMRFRSTDDLSHFMQKELAQVEGLKDSETFVCLHPRKGHFLPPYFGLDS